MRHKTRLIRFGRFARRDSKRFDGRRKPETFNFSGFTHYCGTTLKGKFRVGRKTIRTRLTSKLREVKSVSSPTVFPAPTPCCVLSA
jgi:hypothetical protein